MKDYEKTSIETMEMMLLDHYTQIIKEYSTMRQIILKAEKDSIITTLSIMGYTVSIDVDTDLHVTAVHVRKI